MEVTPTRLRQTGPSTRQDPVTVNGVVIARAAIARETQNHPARKPVEAWMAAARALAIRELLLQEARRLGVADAVLMDDEGRRETEEEALIRNLIEHEVATPDPDDMACRRYYAQNQQRFRSADISEVAHILIAADPGDARARDLARDTAASIISLLVKEPSRFEEIAREQSACPSREVGGSLGQIGPGQTVPEFEKALARMRVGSVHTEPVASRYGFHVVRVDRYVPGQLVPYEAVKERIATYLSERVQHSALRQYISMLAGRAVITGVDLDAAQSPLVQ